MSIRKHKRKAAKHSHKHQNTLKQTSFVSTHPRAAMFTGSALIVIGLFLLIIGMGSDAKFGLAMLSMATGSLILFFAKSALPKKAEK